MDYLYELLSLVNEEAATYAKAMKEELEFSDQEEMDFYFLTLFIGPKTLLAPPYGSVYMEEQGQIMGVSTHDAMRIYHLAGVKKAEDFKEAPDHIRVELAFMCMLIQQTIEACEKSDWLEVNTKIDLQLEFLSKHLAGWVKTFTNNMISNAKTEFYKTLQKRQKPSLDKSLLKIALQ